MAGTLLIKIPARQGITTKVGTGVTINYAPITPIAPAVNAAKASNVPLFFVGNHPTCGAGWEYALRKSEGKEGIDRTTITLETAQETMVQQVYAANPQNHRRAHQQLPICDHLGKGQHSRDRPHDALQPGNRDALADVLFGRLQSRGQAHPDVVQFIDPIAE